MNFAEIIEKVNSDKRLVPDLMKSEKGNNFRAISESAILDVIDPVLKEAGIYYTVDVRDQHLDIREAYGPKGKKLQFIATLKVIITFFDGNSTEHTLSDVISTEAVGMGIDDNDKAMGKAYTYAIKYALLKLFRLRYGDDPDVKASEPLYLDKPKEVSKKEEIKDSSSKKSDKKSGEKLMTENQRDYILGMMSSKGVLETVIISKFHVEPSRDEDIPMKVARSIIKFLEEYKEATDDDLPF